jgi:hypothetical protein
MSFGERNEDMERKGERERAAKKREKAGVGTLFLT